MPTLQGIREYLLDLGLAVQKTPERLDIVDELPTTATGKIQKHLLRADVAAKVRLPAAPSPLSPRQ